MSKGKCAYDRKDWCKPSMFAKRFTDLMAERCINKNQLSKALMLSERSIANYMNGDYMPGAAPLQAICTFFGVSADYLLGLSGSRDLPAQWVKDNNGNWRCSRCWAIPTELSRFCPSCGEEIMASDVFLEE